MRVAGIDIGSNTTRLIIAEVENGKILEILHSSRDITRLGAGLAHTGKLSDESVEKTLAALKRYRAQMDKHGVTRIKTVATSATREASNSAYFLYEAEKLGVPIGVIEGDTEARYTYLGVSAGNDISGKNALIFDIGGGSTEFITGKDGVISYAKSIKLGVVKLADTFDVQSAVTPETDAECSALVNGMIDPILAEAGTPDLLVATAGTPTTLAAVDLEMDDYDYSRVNGYIMPKERIEAIYRRFCSMTAEQRKTIPGLEPGREDLIVPGTRIILNIMEKTGINSLMVSDFGLREGVAIAAAE